jgi:hypothetical protein
VNDKSAASFSFQERAALLVSCIILFAFVLNTGQLLKVAFSPAELNTSIFALLNIAEGNLMTMTVGVVNYWFGSSAGSRQKTELLAASRPANEG